MKTIVTKSGKTLVVRPPKIADLEALYQFAKIIEAEDTFITLNPAEPVTLKEEDQHIKNTINQIKTKQKVYLLVFEKDKIIGSSHVVKTGRRHNHVGQFGVSILKDYRSQALPKTWFQTIRPSPSSCFISRKIN